MSNVAPEVLISAVEGSPAAVAAHDRDRWLDLFSATAEVADPVGSAPSRGREQLTAFYQTFIAPNDISFAVDHDTVAGHTVFRDLTLTTAMDGAVDLHVPMHLRYDLVEEGGEWKIDLLHAHWELPAMVTQLMGTGPRGWWAGTKLGRALLTNQGVRGTIGYLGALRRAGAAGKRAVEGLLGALAAGDGQRAGWFLEAGMPVEFPGAASRSLAEVAALGDTLRFSKLISAGSTVTATIELDGRHGVALADFGRDRKRVSRLRLFLPN